MRIAAALVAALAGTGQAAAQPAAAPAPPAAAPPAAAPPAAAPPAAAPPAASVAAPVEAVPAPPPAPAAAPTSASSICPNDLEPVAASVERAIVIVESPAGRSQGFAFGDTSTFVLPSHVVRLGRGITLRGRDGVEVSATVRAIDPDLDIAIVRSEAPLQGVVALAASDVKVRRGTPVLAFGQPWFGGDVSHGEPARAVTAGIVSVVDNGTFRTDALVSQGATWGTPVVDCEGRVVGMASHWDAVVALGPVESVAKTAAAATEDWSPGWQVSVPVFFAAQFDDDAWLGGKLGVGASYDRSFELHLTGSAFGLVDPEEELRTATVRNRGHRVGAELTAGYALLVGNGAESVHIVPTLGVGVDYTNRTFTSESLRVTGGDCSPEEPCVVERLGETTELGDRTRFMPIGGLAMRFYVFELGWAFHLDPEELGSSTHEVRIGGVF